MRWSDLSNEQRIYAIQRFRENGNYEVLDELKISLDARPTVERRLREGAHWASILFASAQEEEDREKEFDSLVLKEIRAKPVTVAALSDILDRGLASIKESIERLRHRGYVIVDNCDEVTVPKTPPPTTPVDTELWDGCKRVVWAQIADLHCGSLYAQPTALRDFMRIAVEEYGVRHTLIAGDLLAGEKVYRGQEHELYAHGLDEQVDNLVNSYLPYYDENTYWAIGGNHDYVYYKASGVDPLKLIGKEREDVVAVGWDSADIPITKQASINMWHCSGGVPYAMSYKGQRYGAQIAAEELYKVAFGEKEKPTTRVISIGHLHVMGGPFMLGPMWIMQTGCFEGTSGYLKAKGIRPNIGGYIIEASIGSNGELYEMTPHILSYPEKADDWKHYWDMPANAPEPVFRYIGEE